MSLPPPRLTERALERGALATLAEQLAAFYAESVRAGAPAAGARLPWVRVRYISGFSKILTPNWRVGFVAASPAWVERIIDRKLLTALTTPALPERALAVTLEQGMLRRHAERTVLRLNAARQRCVRLAEEAGFAFAAPP